MPTVLPVKFKYIAHELWFDVADVKAEAGDHVICNTARGIEMGLALRDPFEASEYTLNELLGDAPLSSVVRVATEEDFKIAEDMAQKSDEAYPIFYRLAKESGLEMKPVAAEYIFGGDKVVCYFAAEDRVDFRQLVRDLSHELHERIDMRQIGVREEAALTGGFAHCGQELCCARMGARFEPVTIRMAKEQDLPLTSSKISGACGRLMCCLRYEFEAYRDFKSRAPKRSALIDTPLGKATVVEYNTPKEQITLRLENGKTMVVPLSEMTTSKEAQKKCGCSSKGDSGCGHGCRPDTVGRSVLEKMNSPEIQMALAELDRAHGIEVDESVFLPQDNNAQDDDIFVTSANKEYQVAGFEPKSFKKQSRSGSEVSSEKKHPRRVSGSEAKQQQCSKHEKASEQPKREETGMKRRRRHVSEGQQKEKLQNLRWPAEQELKKRREVKLEHVKPEAEGTQSQSKIVVEKLKPRTRRPGDRGGSNPQAPTQKNQDRPVRRTRRVHKSAE